MSCCLSRNTSSCLERLMYVLRFQVLKKIRLQKIVEFHVPTAD